MSAVFLSYDRDDTDHARPLATALEKAGHSVWWDLHVRGGAQFSKVIEEALKAADAVVVLWSANSVESAWVRDEAAVGRDSGRLIPITIEGTEAPLGFRQFQTIDMSGWSGRKSAPNMPELLRAIDAIASGASQGPARTSPKSRPKLRRVPLLLVIAALVVGATAMVLLAWRPWRAAGPPAIAVAAADASPASRDLARDLLTTLGQLQAASSGGLELVGTEERERASLAFEVGTTRDGQQSGSIWCSSTVGMGACSGRKRSKDQMAWPGTFARR